MRLQTMSWPAVAAASKDTPVVVPIAAVEQHGAHLPVFTDSLLLGEVTRRAGESLGDRVIWTPLLWLGNSHHHLDFPGTLSAAPRTYLDVLGDLVDNLVTHGFRRIVLLNGHGGNIVLGSSSRVRGARQRHRIATATTCCCSRPPTGSWAAGPIGSSRRSCRPRWGTPASGRPR